MSRPIILLLILPIAFVRASFPNIRISSDRYASYSKNEVAMAINPRNPDNIIVTSIPIFCYYTFDGGLSWEQKMVPSQYGSAGDPCVVFDRFGDAYFAHLVPMNDRIVIHKSKNGGQTWNVGTYAGLTHTKKPDKEWLTVDMTDSPFKDRLYVAWTEFDVYMSNNPDDSSRILFSYSDDLGQSWSESVRVSDQGGDCTDKDGTVEGAVPAVGPDGTVYVSWGGNNRIMFDKSYDGGVTFGKDVFVTDQPGGWDITIPGLWRANGLPQTLCDTTDSPYRGTIYIVWSDQRNGEDNTDIFLIKSTDQGETWGDMVKVNTDTGRAHQFFPWATIDPATGYLYIVFYDRRNHSGDTTDVYVAKSTDGGASFVDYRVSMFPFVPEEEYFFGDYLGIAALNGKIYPVWTRLDHDQSTIWIALLEDPVPVNVRERKELKPSEFFLQPNYPNPFNGQTVIRFSVPSGKGEIPVQLTLYNTHGQKVRELVDGLFPCGEYKVTLEGKSLAAGMYFYELKAGRFRQVRKLVYEP